MSIRMVQDFVFETDDIKDLETVLETMLPVFFLHGRKTDAVQLQIRTKPPSCWIRDGSENHQWTPGPFIYEDSERKQCLILDTCATYHGATVVHETASFGKKGIFGKSPKEAAAEAACKENDKNNPRKATRMFICSLQDYKEPKPDHVCRGFGDMKETAMELVSRVNPESFYKLCGDGYNDGFRHGDGDVKHGWRMQYEPIGGWNKLVICMTHMYYGK